MREYRPADDEEPVAVLSFRLDDSSESILVTRTQFLALTDWLTQQTVSYDLPDVRDAISRLCYLSRRLQGQHNGE